MQWKGGRANTGCRSSAPQESRGSLLVAVSEGAKMAAAVGATMPNLEGGGVPAGGTECLFDAGDKGMGEV
jgi:hypothetical protein